MRIGLLELVGGAMDQELSELVERRTALHIGGELRSVVRVDQPDDRFAQSCGIRRSLTSGNPLAKRGLEGGLQLRAEGEQRGLPLPALVDLGKAAVVQLVEQAQGDLEVLAEHAGLGGGGKVDRLV